MNKFFLILMTTLCCMSCHPNSRSLDTSIFYVPNEALISRLPDPFTPLSPAELKHEWAKELFLGKKFAKELDLYRALTCFKRSHFLIPHQQNERKLEIEYEIVLSYYLGNKYKEAIDTFEHSRLIDAPETFPALNDLMIILYDSYTQIGQCDRAHKILDLINKTNPELGYRLRIETAIIENDFYNLAEAAAEEADDFQPVSEFLSLYSCEAKSVSKAQTLNALLPGAGYAYVGQQKAAVTSFIINTLFIAASYQLFDRGYIPAAILVTGLEMGWYFGGINGAGLAAKEYNERLYECLARDTLTKNKLFPVLMIQGAF